MPVSHLVPERMSDWARTRRLHCRVVLSGDEPLTGYLHLQPLGSPRGEDL